MQADLHTHTTASDGKLLPDELIELAAASGIEVLAITDHDTIDGYAEVSSTRNLPLTLIPGVEFSSVWQKTGIHIVGLNISTDQPVLLAGIKQQNLARERRAEIIATKLTRLGFENVLDGARSMAGDAPLGRPHFAAWLVSSGQIGDEKTAFKKHLGQGKCGDIRTEWPNMKTVINWITASGGIAVLAHPAKYKLTNSKLDALVSQFKLDGGQAIEVVCGQQNEQITDKLAKLAIRHGLYASCGSDFHRPGQPWAMPGNIPALPSGLSPVWEYWQK
ncbi:MAG: PHP domain-containing protein [Gammaproteobacteria bacterium]